MNHAPDVPNDRFFAMTMLDELRARYQLAAKANVDITDISQLTIWGNHSATQYPDFYNAKIKSEPVSQYISDETWLQTDFVSTVQQRGAAIIKARDASSAASAANAAMETVRRIEFDTENNESYSVALCSQGEYDVDSGLIFSFPCRTEQGKLSVITDVKHNEFGQQKFQATLEELRQERDTVKELGLID